MADELVIEVNGFRLRPDRGSGWKLRCPGCQSWAFIDDDQLHGRVSVDCPNCTFHETHDFWLLLKTWAVNNLVEEKVTLGGVASALGVAQDEVERWLKIIEPFRAEVDDG